MIFCEHKMLYGETGEVPDGEYIIPFGQANVTRKGSQVTIVAFARMVLLANKVADKLAKEGISVEVIDPRTTSPLDRDSDPRIGAQDRPARRRRRGDPVLRHGERDRRRSRPAKRFDALKAPVQKVTPPHTPVPATPDLEQVWIPSPDRIEQAVRATLLGQGLARTG